MKICVIYVYKLFTTCHYLKKVFLRCQLLWFFEIWFLFYIVLHFFIFFNIFEIATTWTKIFRMFVVDKFSNDTITRLFFTFNMSPSPAFWIITTNPISIDLLTIFFYRNKITNLANPLISNCFGTLKAKVSNCLI